MDREALDAFFAKAEDVLTDWDGGTDAMVARVPESDDVEALPGDSYYEQPRGTWSRYGATFGPRYVWSMSDDPLVPLRIEWLERDPEAVRLALERLNTAARDWGRQLSEMTEQLRVSGSVFVTDYPEAVVLRRVPQPTAQARAAQDHALSLRRNRNTGPADPVRLDGRRARRASR